MVTYCCQGYITVTDGDCTVVLYTLCHLLHLRFGIDPSDDLAGVMASQLLAVCHYPTLNYAHPFAAISLRPAYRY